jgi:hypothetical protein
MTPFPEARALELLTADLEPALPEGTGDAA